MFNPTQKEILEIAEAAKKVMQKEVDEPKAKGEKDFVNMHKKNVKVTTEPNDEKPLKVPMKMSEGKMNQLHQLVSKGVKDPKKIAKELGLPNTKEVHKAIASLIAGMKEGLDAVNKTAVKKKFANRKDKDIDNDGDVDDSDEYLHKRRKAISKATSENKKKIAEAASFSKFKSEPHLDSLDEAIEYIAEHGDIDNLTEEQLDEVIATVAKGIAKGVGAVAKGAGKLAVKGAKKATQRLSTTGRADAAEKKAKSIEKKNADKERLKRAKERIGAAKAKAKDEKDKTARAKERKKIAQAKAKEDMKKRAERSKKMAKEEDELDEAKTGFAVGDEVSFKWPSSISSKVPLKNRKPGGYVKGTVAKVDGPRAKVKIGNAVYGVSMSDLKKEMKEALKHKTVVKIKGKSMGLVYGPASKQKTQAAYSSEFDKNPKYVIHKYKSGFGIFAPVKKEMKEEVELEEKNDALYLIYKDKIKAQQVRNFIKKMYRNKTEVEYAPMDAKNFGVSVFSDRGQADKVKKAVDKKFGKPDDFMLEQV